MKQSFILKKISIFCVFILLNALSKTAAIAQTSNDSVSKCPIVSVPDLFKKKDLNLVKKPAKTNFFLLIPIIGSQPATGFMYGAIAQYTFKGKLPDDKYSSISMNATYTTKEQLLVSVKNNILLKNNSVFLIGDYRFYVFSQSNYGLGTNIIPKNFDKSFDIASVAEPMEYNYFKFHQTASWELTDNLYAGGGIAIDWYSSIVDQNLDVAAGQHTYHYDYSKQYGYNNLEYTVNGVSLNLIYDSRDNQINTNHGWFANINYRLNPKLNNNQQVSNVLFAEGRYFIPLSKTNLQHVLGFWTYGQFLVSGSVPYLNLPAIGWDQRNRGGKGYIQGLFRGYNIVYFETEYRFPISCNQLISGTVFANFTTASNKDIDVKLFDYIQPAVGVGLRILIDKKTRTNIILNQAWGRDSDAFYLNAGETF